MPPVYEQRAADGAGRLGQLRVPKADATIETPALLPVVNPNVQAIAPSRLVDEFGAQACITNAYIIHGTESLREVALEEGVHELLGFDGPVMTDSGSFQLAAYGDIDVTTEEILAFQRAIGSDIATPVDIPTPPDVERQRAEDELEATQSRLEVAAGFDAGEMLVTGPVQGSTFPDLRERAGREARETGLDVFPVGGAVPLLTAYRYADLVEAVVAAKRGLGVDAPVHLFGAGHPMVFALAAAMGCDLFDSAAYSLYARDDRYLTVGGTARLDSLHELPCACPVCTSWTAAELRDAPPAERHRALAAHNLHVSFGELRRVRQAIRDGALFELVEARARAHPTMLDGYRALLDHADWLERHDPVSKGAFFQLSAESARRPEVRRHRDRLDRLAVPARLCCFEGWPRPAGGEPTAEDASPDGRHDSPTIGDEPTTDGDGSRDGSHPSGAPAPADLDLAAFDAVWAVVPPFGPVPPALAETYPLSAEVPRRVDAESQVAAARAVARLATANPKIAVTLAHQGWPAHALARLPEDVTTVDLDGAADP